MRLEAPAQIKFILIFIMATICLNSTHIFASYWSVHPSGSDAWLWTTVLLVMPAILSLIVAIIATACLLYSKIRKEAFVALACSLFWLGTFVLCGRIGEAIRIHAFLELSQRSSPIIEAIRAYEARNGSPPDKLERLVPEYLPNTPSTGMRAYPTYALYLPKSPDDIDGNPWMLYVSTPEAGINFDVLMYLPKENYPETGYGGWLEPVGHWAYVHE